MMRLASEEGYSVRPVRLDQDYALLSEWWVGHGKEPYQPMFLPPHGVIVSRHGKAMAALFLFQTDTALAWLETAVVDPEAPVKERSHALMVAVDALTLVAGAKGYARVIAWPEYEGINRQLEARGWQRFEGPQLMRRDL